MSYGWLTESSILPKKQVKIDIESKTFIDLKVNLLKEKEKLKRKDDNQNKLNYTNKNIIKSKLNLKNVHQIGNNKDGRIEIYTKDKEIQLIDPEIVDYERIKDQLAKKELIYEKLRDIKFKDLEQEESLLALRESCMVDFDYKRIEEKRKKNSIFSEISKEIQNSECNINSDCMLELNEPEKKVLVKQSYDKILSQKEKEALECIIEEETDYKKKIELLKKKKNSEREERLERIKKMKIENDDSKFN